MACQCLAKYNTAIGHVSKWKRLPWEIHLLKFERTSEDTALTAPVPDVIDRFSYCRMLFSMQNACLVAAQKTRASAHEGQEQGKNLPFVAAWHLGPAAGRQFGRLNGDINPIHVSSVAARMFGFSSCIAHGALLLAQALTAVEALPDCGMYHFSVPRLCTRVSSQDLFAEGC